jgi:hypothetical protein
MKAEFTSGAWVELRGPQELTARDKARFSDATYMPYISSNAGAVHQFSLGNIHRQQDSVIAFLITAWSYDWILPSEDQSVNDDGRLVFEQSLQNLPIDDYNELEEVIAPHLEKLRGGPKATVVTTGSSKASSSGGPKPHGRRT